MSKTPFFSICIPTYNSVIFLKKLINSLELQDFKNFEVIISDDSTTDDIFVYVSEINNIIKNISYYKRDGDGNATNNWNNALSFAKGEYKMLIHHDDYFFINNSLNEIYLKIIENDNPSVLFLSFVNENSKSKFFYHKYYFKNILKYPEQLLYVNYLSTPSCLILNKDVKEIYDSKLKWIVDVELYIRVLKKYSKIMQVKAVKIIIGGDDSKITNSITKKDILNEYYYFTKSIVFRYELGLLYIYIRKLEIIIKQYFLYLVKNN